MDLSDDYEATFLYYKNSREKIFNEVSFRAERRGSSFISSLSTKTRSIFTSSFLFCFSLKKKGNISFWASIWIVTTLIIRASICAVCSKTISIEKPLKRSRITSESLVHHQAPILTISHKWSTITWNVHPSISQIRSPILAASNEFSSCCSLN